MEAPLSTCKMESFQPLHFHPCACGLDHASIFHEHPHILSWRMTCCSCNATVLAHGRYPCPEASGWPADPQSLRGYRSCRRCFRDIRHRPGDRLYCLANADVAVPGNMMTSIHKCFRPHCQVGYMAQTTHLATKRNMLMKCSYCT